MFEEIYHKGNIFHEYLYFGLFQLYIKIYTFSIIKPSGCGRESKDRGLLGRASSMAGVTSSPDNTTSRGSFLGGGAAAAAAADWNKRLI